MLHDPTRHEALTATPWSADVAQRCIEHIARGCAQGGSAQAWWPPHPRDVEPGDAPDEPFMSLYDGAAGVVWALHYLGDVGAAPALPRFGLDALEALVARNRARLATRRSERDESPSFLIGQTPLLMMMQGLAPTAERADRLAALIECNLDHPAREFLWGSPGTMLAALFLHRRFGASDTRWAGLVRRGAAKLWSQLEAAPELGCRCWSQDLYGQHSHYIGAGHGFIGNASVVLRGRDLLTPAEWEGWQREIANTVLRTAQREDGAANWTPRLVHQTQPPPRLMQWCHGAPGFVIALAAGWPQGSELDAVLLEAGEAVWRAGPLAKGSNLCHGTGGNGYAFLVLFERTGDERWLERARAFAMHGIAQSQADEAVHGRLRHSLWTGDPGLAIYLWDCLRARAAFPTLDVFYGAP